MGTPALNASQARAIAKAEADYASAKAKLEQAKEDREKVRERYRDRLPIGQEVVAGGVRIKRSQKSTGQRFSLSRYLEKHKLTAAMKPFVSLGSYEDWQVKPAG